jgi:hypothetical protein
MAAAIDQHGSIATLAQRWDLVAPIATMAQATMQQNHHRAGTIRRVPYSRAVVLDIAQIICMRQRRGAIRFKLSQIVVVHSLLISLDRSA